jgi:hypothetical protein
MYRRTMSLPGLCVKGPGSHPGAPIGADHWCPNRPLASSPRTEDSPANGCIPSGSGTAHELADERFGGSHKML